MKKTGFSLVEILITLGIIAVVSAMGFSISQRNMENAYKGYWYTGYKAIADCFFDAGMNNKLTNIKTFGNHAADLMNASATSTNNNNSTITAPNGIVYKIVGGSNGSWYVLMTIPSPVKKKASKNLTAFVINTKNNTTPDYRPLGLYPAAAPKSSSSKFISLQNRVDLLPFIIQNGRPQGVTDASGKTKIFSYQEAYCYTHSDSLDRGVNYLNIDCSGLNTDIGNGLIVPVNPKKVF